MRTHTPSPSYPLVTGPVLLRSLASSQPLAQPAAAPGSRRVQPTATTPPKQPWSIKSAKPSGTSRPPPCQAPTPTTPPTTTPAASARSVYLSVCCVPPELFPPSNLLTLPAFPRTPHPPIFTARPARHRQAHSQHPPSRCPPPRYPPLFLPGHRLPLHRCCRCLCPRRTRPRQRHHHVPPPLLCRRPLLPPPQPHQCHQHHYQRRRLPSSLRRVLGFGRARPASHPCCCLLRLLVFFFLCRCCCCLCHGRRSESL